MRKEVNARVDDCPAGGRNRSFCPLSQSSTTQGGSGMTKAQEVYERVEELVAKGTSKADAFRQLAEEMERPINSVRGAYYQHTKRTGGTRPKRRETTPADAVDDAKALLTRAIDSIDDEITVAKERADEATAEYKALKESATDRKRTIEAKIAALEA
jgi:hypothetical protein